VLPADNTGELLRKSLRRRWLRRLGLLAGLTFGCLAGLLLLVHSDFFAQRVRLLLIDQGSAFLGENLHIQGLELSFRPLSVEATGIQVHSRDPLRPGQEILRVDRLALEGLRMEGPGRFELANIDIDDPVLRLRVADGELRDFPGLQKRPRGRKSRLFIQQLAVTNGEVSVSIEGFDTSVRFSGIGADMSTSGESAAEVDVRIEDIGVRVGQVEKSLVLQSGRVVREDNLVRLEGYRFVSDAGTVAVDGELTLSPVDEQGAIIGNVGYDIDAVATVDLGQFTEGTAAIKPMRGRVDVHTVVQGIDEDIRVHGRAELEKGRFGKMDLGDADARFEYYAGIVRLDRIWAGYGGGEITGWGSVNLEDPVSVAADLKLQKLQLAQIMEAVNQPPPWVMLTISGTARVAGTIKGGLKLAVDTELPVEELLVYGQSYHERALHEPFMRVSGGIVAGHLDVLGDKTVLSDITVTTAHSRLNLDAEFIYAKPLILDLHIHPSSVLEMEDIDHIAGLPFRGRGPTRVHIYGPTKDLQIDGHTDLTDFEMMGYSLGRVDTDIFWHAREDLVFADLVANLGETVYTGEGRLMFGKPMTMDWAFRFDDARMEDMIGILAPDLAVAGLFDGHIHVNGPWKELDGTAKVHARGVSLLGEQFSSADLDFTARRGRFTLTDAYFRKGRGGIYGRGYIDSHGPMNFELMSYAMDLDQVTLMQNTQLPLEGKLAAKVHLWGTVKRPLVHGTIGLTETQYRRATLGDSTVKVMLRDSGLLVLNGTLLGRPSNALWAKVDTHKGGAYEFTVDWSNVPLHLLLSPRTLAAGPVRLVSDGHMEGNGHLEGTPDHDILMEDIRIELEREEQRLANSSPIRLRVDGDHLIIEDFSLTGPRSDLTVEGTVGPGKRIHLTAQGELDIGLVDIFVPDMGRCEAERTELFLNVTGDRTGPNVTAWLELEQGSVRSIHFPHPLQVDDARFMLRDNKVLVERFAGMLGGGAIEGFVDSSIQFAGGRPHSYDVHATCVDCWLKYPSFLPRARGTADLDLTGTVPNVELSGTVDVEEMTYRDDFNWQSSIIRPGSRYKRSGGDGEEEQGKGLNLGLDITVRSEGGFGISNNLGQADAEGEVRVFGNTERVGLDGSLRAVSGGRIWFKGHEFDLISGIFDFPDEWSLDPRFTLGLNTDVSTAKQRYAITYEIEGFLSDPGAMTIFGSSNPSLSEADINALLLFGVTMDELQGFGGGADMMALATQAGNIGLGYLMEQVRESSGERTGERDWVPDRLEVVPDYTSSGNYSGMRLMIGKELVPNRLTGSLSFNPLDMRNIGLQLDWRVGRNLHLIPSWYQRPENTLGALGEIGDTSLDMRWVIEGD